MCFVIRGNATKCSNLILDSLVLERFSGCDTSAVESSWITIVTPSRNEDNQDIERFYAGEITSADTNIKI